MRLPGSIWTCLILLIVSLLRAGQLYRQSTAELRPSPIKPSPLPFQHEVPPHLRQYYNVSQSAVLNKKPDGIFYFIQVSDLHLSKYQAKGHTVHFLHFLQSILPMVRPEFVVVTGDLTDAKAFDKVKTEQYLEEWKVYHAAVQQGARGVDWYDMRGNHDCFNLASWDADNNLYRDYGKSAKLLEEGHGVYSWQVEKPFGKYQFVAVDACPKRGPSRPINFFGYVTSLAMDRLSNLIMGTNAFNHSFLFAHYPTTTVAFGVSQEGYTFRDIAQRASAYFCGHLHRLVGGLGDVLKSYDINADLLELELADLKDHGAYRIVAVDHDLISFVDMELPLERIPHASPEQLVPMLDNGTLVWPKKINPAPVVLITNPKDARYTLETKEPLHYQRLSSHIRFLVFSETTVKINIKVDGKHHPFPAEYVGSSDSGHHLPLWVSAWEPNDFGDFESHTLEIEAVAEDGQVGKASVVFRMDNVHEAIHGGVGEWIISTHMASLLRALTLLGIGAMLTALLAPRLYATYASFTGSKSIEACARWVLLQIHEADYRPSCGPFPFIYRQTLVWTLRFIRFAEEQPVMWHGVFFYSLAVMTLPWFRAEFIPSDATDRVRFGTFYIWGLLFGNEWVPLADTWKYAIFQVALNVGVFFILFAWKSTHGSDLHCRGAYNASQHARQLNEYPWFSGLVAIYWLWRMAKLISFSMIYGGLWPMLLTNTMLMWLIFVGGVLVWGKGGLTTSKHDRVGVVLEDCIGCQEALSRGSRGTAPNSAIRGTESHTVTSGTYPDNIESDANSMGSSSSSTSTSSTINLGTASPRPNSRKQAK